MNGLAVIFIVVFVLAVAAICALLVLRMLGTLELPQSPPFPRRHARALHHPQRPADHASPTSSRAEEELAGKH